MDSPHGPRVDKSSDEALGKIRHKYCDLQGVLAPAAACQYSRNDAKSLHS